jgi:hypothetical protein
LNIAALLLAVQPLVARGQDSVHTIVDPPAGSCLISIPRSAFRRVAVYASVLLHDSASARFGSSADNLLQESVIRAQRLLGARGNVVPNGEPIVSWHEVDAPLHIVAYRNGRITRRPITRGPDSSAAALMATALDSVDVRGLLDWSADSARDSIAFDFAFSRPVLDSAGKITLPHPTRTAIPLLAIAEPWEREVAPISGSEHPEYPEFSRARDYEGNVLLSFVVDTSGRAVASTIHDLWPRDKPRLHGTSLLAYQAFVDESKEFVAGAHFVPASLAGCLKSQLVQMPFHYQLNK